MTRPDPFVTARAVVAMHVPGARQAWLAGSVVDDRATSTSDLDVTVLLDDGQPHRTSLTHEGWPVELFVHTEASIRWFVAKDLARRRPTMARLVASGVPLLDGDAGAALRDECAAVVSAGPPALTGDALALARYALTDLLDDLAGGGQPFEVSAVAAEAWRSTAELLLASQGRWGGTGTWLAREVSSYDESCGTSFGPRLHDSLGAALAGDPAPLVSVADDVLALVGGRLWSGFRLDAPADAAPGAGRA
ncbi:nucleotidyltransferase domain-containing protein [Nocardioides sp.]|uniref:nucleotidyltransferase domain-containing protein n=1 Tax=Nocardioides sp. TaxID=35761 RepID=UPI00286B2F06|nr:nucleotidyltransferase domain-containing protein [Nocardioides sp.]